MAGLVDITLGNNTIVLITDAVDYDTRVTNLQSIGEFGDEASIIEVSEYGSKYKRKLVGSASAGPLELTVNFNPFDASFILLESLYTSGKSTAVKLEMKNSDSSETSSIMFTALVASKTISNEFDGVRTATFTLAIDGGTSPVVSEA